MWDTRVPTPRDDYDGTIRRDCATGRRGGAARSAVTARSASACPARFRRRPVSSRTPTRPGSTASRFRRRSRAALGRDVRLANDANCLAVSEAADGAAAGAAVVFGVILGTGTGGGLVVARPRRHGRQRDRRRVGPQPAAVAGRRRAAGPACYCGRHGCIETFLSGPACRRLPAARRATRARAEDVMRRADAGETPRALALATPGRRLARALARSSTSSIPTSSSSAAACRASRRSTRTCHAVERSGFSRITWPRASCRRSTATPAASAARRGLWAA